MNPVLFAAFDEVVEFFEHRKTDDSNQQLGDMNQLVQALRRRDVGQDGWRFKTVVSAVQDFLRIGAVSHLTAKSPLIPRSRKLKHRDSTTHTPRICNFLFILSSKL